MSHDNRLPDRTETVRGAESPLLSAFRIGRCITRWYFFAIQRWLGALAANSPCNDAAKQLALEVRGIVRPVNRDELQQTIRKWEQDWESSLNSEERSEELYEAIQELASHDDMGRHASHRHEIDRLLGPPST